MTGILLPLFAFTLGLSALLLFWVQPLYARLMLPLLGGAPAVWITAMLFFQAVLLAGYLYAHLSIRWLGAGRQPLLHAVLLLAAFLALPIALPEGWAPPSGAMPLAWQLALMAAGVGLPFFAVSASAPLLQRWFSHTGHVHAADPYFLYGASNLGSIAALALYPLAIEPLWRLGEQAVIWTAGYGLLVLLIGGCAWAMRRNYVSEAAGGAEDGLTLASDIGWSRKLWWIALSFAPSSLMLGVTLHISTDIAAVPLLWVAPLILYLLTFVIVFARRPLLPHRWVLVLQVPVLILLSAILIGKLVNPWLALAIHLGAFFVIALACHGELAARRPAAKHLTEFYLWMAVGGVLGGIFNAVMAPLLFDTVLEYPLVIVAVALLRPWRGKFWEPRPLGLDFALPIIALMALTLLSKWLQGADGVTASVLLFGFAVPAAMFFAWRGSPIRFTLGLLVVMAASLFASVQSGRTDGIAGTASARETADASARMGGGGGTPIFTERSYFGVNRVTRVGDPRPAHKLLHGTTVHGAQYLDGPARLRPLTYYHPLGPLGQMFGAFPADRFSHVGVIGLGSGAASCYAKPGQSWTFFEIDPVVERIARDDRYFTYLRDCAPGARVILGDARLSLQAIPDGHFDLLVLDAFSSDSIPVHLVTAEAFALYRAKLAPGGIMAVHMSNRFLRLAPVVGRVAAESGLSGIVQHFDGAPEAPEPEAFRVPSDWAVLARAQADIAGLAADSRWRPLAGDQVALWTDDYVNILATLSLRGSGPDAPAR